jgi:predicted acylesterase/phospholipase RssA
VNHLGIASPTTLSVALVIQGGGAKGAWQGGFLNGLLDDTTITPVAAMGSSAGAINAALVSEKLADRQKDPFAPAWRSLRCFVRRHLGVLLRGLVHHIRHNDGDLRRSHHFNKALLQQAIARALPAWRCRLYTYIQACDISGPLPIQTRNGRYPASPFYAFEARNGYTAFGTNLSRNQTTPVNWVDHDMAIGASACLPSMEPFEIYGTPLMDGGMMSNLPLEFTASSPNIGAPFVLLILPRPIRDLDPSTSFVDWNVVEALRSVQTRLRPDDRQIYCVIEPESSVWSGLFLGLLIPGLQRLDQLEGAFLANNFLRDVENFLYEPRSNFHLLRKYDLRYRQLPDAPVLAPREAWMDYANRSWRR